MKLIMSLSCLCLVLAAQSGTSRRIAFATEFEGKLRLLDYSTARIRSIDVGLSQLNSIAYCKAAALLALEGEDEREESAYALYLWHLDTGKGELLHRAGAGENYYRPTFDPACQYLYAVSLSLGLGRYSLSGKGWDRVQITGAKVQILQEVAFSRSGRKVAISPENFKGFLIAGNEGKQLVVERSVLADFLGCISPIWIGDETLLFAGRREKGYQCLWRYDLETDKVRQLTYPPLGTRDFLSLSADGRTIVFTATTSRADWKLWEISVDGTGLRQLTRGSGSSNQLSPVWVE
jgi:hypothetical protein